jgi:hypothetical protein
MNPISLPVRNAGAIFTPSPTGTSVDVPVVMSIETTRVVPPDGAVCL